jgi:hypothetical protein
MPTELTNQGDFLLARFYGVVTVAELVQAASELEVVEDSIPTPMDRIIDLTAVERFEFGFSAVSFVASQRRVRRFSKSVKSALIVSDPVQFGLARMFQTMNDNPQIEIQILPSVAQARDWFAGKTKVDGPGGPSYENVALV